MIFPIVLALIDYQPDTTDFSDNQSADLRIVRGPDEIPLSVIGRFDVGLDAHSSWEDDAIALAIDEFITRHSSAFGNRHADISVLSVRPHSDDIHMATLEQSVEGLKIWDSVLTAVFDLDGNLLSLNGMVRSPMPIASANDSFAASDALDAVIVASADGVVADDVPVDYTGFQKDGSRYVRLSDGSYLQRGIEPESYAVSWRASLPTGIFTVDEGLATVIDVVSRKEQAKHFTSCNIRHPDFPRDGNGKATSIVMQSGTTTDTDICMATDDVFGQCYWQLKWQPDATDQTIDRVLDDDGAEQEVVQSCTSSNVPQFTLSGSDGMREQTAWWAIRQSRESINANGWTQWTPDCADWVHPHADASSQNACGGACFDNASHDISATSAFGGQFDTWAHEYGHYVEWTYLSNYSFCIGGGYSQNCNGSTDQGDAVAETMANIYGLLAVSGESTIDPVYGAADGFGNGQSDPPHRHWHITSINDESVGIPACFPAGNCPLTVVTSVANDLAVGDPVTISGVTSRTFNGDYTVGSIINSTTFRTAQADPGNDDEAAATVGEIDTFEDVFTGPCVGVCTAGTNDGTSCSSSSNCTGGGRCDFHNMGRSLEQAIWEVIFNKDCAQYSCTGTNGFSNQLWTGGQSKSHVRQAVGGALGYAVSASGPNATFNQIAANFSTRINQTEGSTVRAKVDSVLEHHGFSP